MHDMNPSLASTETLKDIPHDNSPLPLVSIIVRTVARPQMLRKAIQSIAEQSYPLIELLVVNDGTEDISSLVKQGAKKSIATHKYILNTGIHGRSRAANLGLEHATGQFLGFLDDDDWLLPDHVSRLVHKLLEIPSAPAAYSGVDCISLVGDEEMVIHCFNEPFSASRLAYNNFMPIHSVLFRSRLLQYGYKFDEGLEMFEDWHFWLQLSCQGDFVHVQEVTAKYLISQTSGVGLPSAKIDITSALEKFTNASRNIWTNTQLRQLCEYSYQLNFGKEKNNNEAATEDANSKEIVKIQSLKKNIEEKTSEIDKIISSRSWRLTHPLRMIGKIIRRASGKPKS